MGEKRNLRSKRLVLFGALLAAGSASLLAAARQFPGFGQWYAVHIYPVLVASFGRLFGLLPFSASELGLYGLAAAGAFSLVKCRRRPLSLLPPLFFLACALLFSYTLGCGINYYRNPFSSYLTEKSGEASPEDLRRLCAWLTDRVNESCLEAGADGNSWRDLQKKGAASMNSLAEVYPSLAGFYPKPKPVLVSGILSFQQLSGVYSPFTVEANYNRDMVPYNIPHTVCHELSHLRGFMREDEANFIGYLACLNSEFSDYHYSGYLVGWIYAGNALAKEDYAEYLRLYRKLSEPVKEDLLANSRFWDRHEGQVADMSNRVNDVYLKANGQEEGVKTYGRVVDLMLADFLENRGNLSCNRDGKMVK